MQFALTIELVEAATSLAYLSRLLLVRYLWFWEFEATTLHKHPSDVYYLPKIQLNHFSLSTQMPSPFDPYSQTRKTYQFVGRLLLNPNFTKPTLNSTDYELFTVRNNSSQLWCRPYISASTNSIVSANAPCVNNRVGRGRMPTLYG